MIFAIAAELRSCDEDFKFVVQALTTKELTLTIHKSVLTTHPSPSRTSEPTQTRGNLGNTEAGLTMTILPTPTSQPAATPLPGIIDNAMAREQARRIAAWTPLPEHPARRRVRKPPLE
jgi:hypothetical protein